VTLCAPGDLPGHLRGSPVSLATPLWLLGLGLLVLELFLLRRPGGGGAPARTPEMGREHP